MIDAVKQLEAYALAHYEQGGHWVYETHDVADYVEYLERAQGDVAAAKQLVREYWELICDRERDCAFGDGEY